MLALVLLALGAPQSLAGQGAASPGSGAQALSRRACPPAAIGNATCAALVRIPPAGQAPPAALTRRASPAGRAAPAAGEGEEPLTPGQLADAYEYNPSSGGSGQVVAIVDAYQDPQIEADLAAYDAHYGLASCTEGDGCLEKVGQSGTASLPARDSSGWSVETSLDVETVHSVCAKCKILLVEADSESFTNLAAAEDTAVRLGATVVSNSYSGPEEGMDSAQQAAYDHPGVVIAAATGDDGYYDWDFYNEGPPARKSQRSPARRRRCPTSYLWAAPRWCWTAKASAPRRWSGTTTAPGTNSACPRKSPRGRAAAAAAPCSAPRCGSRTLPASPPAAAAANA